MTWDTSPSDPANSSTGQPQGFDGPSWWDESGVPTRKTATSVRSAVATQSVRGANPILPAGNGSNGSGSNGSNGNASQAAGVLAAKRAKPRARSKSRTFTSPVSLRVALGFTVGVIGALFLAAAAVFGLSRAYDGKIMPGVHAGIVDLSGLTRDQAITAINTEYASLGQGKVTITTPVGTGTITYQDAGRKPDAVAMADAAMSVGHGDNTVASMASALRTFAGGVDIPVIVKLDPLALETKLRAITDTSLDPPKDANVAVSGGNFSVVPGAAGRGIDETKIATGLIDQLSTDAAPSEFVVGGTFVTVQPNVTDKDAQAAIDSANKMSVDVTLTYNTKTWTIPGATIRSWLIFGVRTDGTFGPVVNPALVMTWVGTIGKDVNVTAVEPNITYTNGTPTGVLGGKPGVALDINGTSQAIEAYLDALGSGGTTNGAGVTVLVNVTQPTLTQNVSLAGFSVIGSWNTTYFPGESNGNGVNISVPANILNGRVIQPGEHFSFLRAVGPIDPAHGFALGGVILKGVSNHTGAMGGGICSASTTFFNAAVRAGLQIDERHAHFYHIDRYPMGLDATVYSNGSTTWDMRFTNDTAFPIVIRSYTTGSRTVRVIHVQFWSKSDGRKTVFSTPVVTDTVAAKDTTVYVPSLPGGVKSYRKEYPTAGMNAYVTRTVTDSTGAVIHYDQWYSHYTKVDGILQIAGTPPPPKTPTPPPTKAPATTPPPVKTPTPTPRRRRLLVKVT
jgi:vancomycin resistance protein YoaR